MADNAHATARDRSKAEEWELDQKQIMVGNRFGEGAVGEVFKGKWRGLDVAVKKIRASGDTMATADMVNEILVLSHLRHPNLVMFLGAVTTGDAPVIVFEYMPGGSVEDFFREKSRKKGGLPWIPPRDLSHRWCLDLAKALCFLHNCNPMIVHRDVKPANLLLTSDSSLKLADFGISKSIKRDGAKLQPYKMTGVTGSKRYMAPEVYKSQDYDESVDIFSYSMCAWYMHFGQRPLGTYDGDEAVSAYCENQRPATKGLAKEMAEHLEACWSTDKTKRPSAAELVDQLEAMHIKASAVGGKCVCM